ncbi:MAG: T9SS type A sorting domain-containing protein, partial [Candidatus Eisenbacteria bacterium]|nr:T9SS type A sorting domain-containing protein [Candidatus Eisenbacteria bacterium]
GLVHILAPWRQVYDYKCKSSIVVDCEDTIVFSQKPFESFPAANTSLAMVALIGCERALIPEGTEGHVPLDLEYVVPDWVAELSPGHDYLVAGETTNFRDLLYACIMTEGGDAGLAIADILYPGNHTISDMAYAMNQRAWELGMTSTNFTRPALFWESSGDAEDHHTSAYDLYLLARAAKENPLFDQIANTRSRHDVREFADQGPTITLMNNWFLMDLQDSIEKSSGIKKGWTEDSGTALLYTADGPSGGSAVVATLATPEYGEYGQTAIDMMELGLGQCFNLVAEQWNGDINYLSDGIYAVVDETVGISGQFQVLSDDAQFELFFLPGGQVPEVMAEISVSHTSYLALEYLQSTTLGLSPLGADQGARVTNAGANNAAVRLNGTLHVIPPGESVSLPRREDLHYWEVENAGEIRAELVVEETYVHSLHYLNEDGEYPPDPIFTATMARREFVESDQFAYSIRWLTTGGQFVMALHDEQVTADAPGPPRGISTPALQVDAHTYPNPSWDRISIAMRLSEAANVELDIYDASGRRIRHFPHEARLAGSATVEWDGRDDGGELLPPGVYFYRISLTKGEAEGEASPSGVGRVSVGGRIVRVR